MKPCIGSTAQEAGGRGALPSSQSRSCMACLPAAAIVWRSLQPAHRRSCLAFAPSRGYRLGLERDWVRPARGRSRVACLAVAATLRVQF